MADKWKSKEERAEQSITEAFLMELTELKDDRPILHRMHHYRTRQHQRWGLTEVKYVVIILPGFYFKFTHTSGGLSKALKQAGAGGEVLTGVDTVENFATNKPVPTPRDIFYSALPPVSRPDVSLVYLCP